MVLRTFSWAQGAVGPESRGPTKSFKFSITFLTYMASTLSNLARSSFVIVSLEPPIQTLEVLFDSETWMPSPRRVRRKSLLAPQRWRTSLLACQVRVRSLPAIPHGTFTTKVTRYFP